MTDRNAKLRTSFVEATAIMCKLFAGKIIVTMHSYSLKKFAEGVTGHRSHLCSDLICTWDATEHMSRMHVMMHGGVKSKTLTKELHIVLHSLAVQGMEHSMACSVSCTSTSVCLASLAKLQALTTKCSLIDFPLICPREGETIVFQLNYSLWCFSAHVLDGVLIS